MLLNECELSRSFFSSKFVGGALLCFVVGHPWVWRGFAMSIVNNSARRARRGGKLEEDRREGIEGDWTQGLRRGRQTATLAIA